MKDWTGGYYLVFKRNPMVPGDRLLVANGYKYNDWKVLSFIETEEVGITKTTIPYLSN